MSINQRDCLECGRCESCIDRSIIEWESHNREYALENGGMDEEFPSETEILIAAIRNVLKNMRIVPDFGNQGLTDCYSVPLDDIEDLEICLKKYEVSKQAKATKQGNM